MQKVGMAMKSVLSRVDKNPGFFFKPSPGGFFGFYWVFWGFIVFFGVFFNDDLYFS